MEDEDGRVWSEKQIGIRAIGLKRCLGADNDG